MSCILMYMISYIIYLSLLVQVSQSLCFCLSFSLNSGLWGNWQHPVEFWTRLHAEEFRPHPDHHHRDERRGSPAGRRVRGAVLLRMRSHYKQEPLRSGELQLWAGGRSQAKERKTQCTEILLRGMRNDGRTQETYAGQCWRNVLRTLLQRFSRSRLSVILRTCRKRNWPLEGDVYRLYSQTMIVYCLFVRLYICCWWWDQDKTMYPLTQLDIFFNKPLFQSCTQLGFQCYCARLCLEMCLFSW